MGSSKYLSSPSRLRTCEKLKTFCERETLQERESFITIERENYTITYKKRALASMITNLCKAKFARLLSPNHGQ
jgi:hypothetical protein